MESSRYSAFAETLRSKGAGAAIDQLIETLTVSGDYHRVFEAMTLKARRELGIPLILPNAGDTLSNELREKYEDQVIVACREVGGMFLRSGDIPNAHRYLSMIGETDEIAAAIERYEPAEGAIDESILEIAINRGVHPAKGLRLILERYGLCQAISTCQGILAQPTKPGVREECIRLLVRAIHEELVGRLEAEIEQREGEIPPGGSIPLLLKDRDWLFENDNYHIDTSHLSAVVRLSRLLPRCDETILAVHLCDYGRRLSDRYVYPDAAPFEKAYEDSFLYLRTVAGIDSKQGLAHFREKAEAADIEEVGTAPLETYVNLLLQTRKVSEAIEFAGKHLNRSGWHGGICPSMNELCQEAGAFETMARLAQERDDLVSFAAGLLQHSEGLRA